jgi:hypothetical protein
MLITILKVVLLIGIIIISIRPAKNKRPLPVDPNTGGADNIINENSKPDKACADSFIH